MRRFLRPGLQGRLSCGSHHQGDDGDDGVEQFDDSAVVVGDRDENDDGDDMASSIRMNY